MIEKPECTPVHEDFEGIFDEGSVSDYVWAASEYVHLAFEYTRRIGHNYRHPFLAFT
jgi:hypothetical protein